MFQVLITPIKRDIQPQVRSTEQERIMSILRGVYDSKAWGTFVEDTFVESTFVEGTLVEWNIGRMEHWSNGTLLERNIGRMEHSSNGALDE